MAGELALLRRERDRLQTQLQLQIREQRMLQAIGEAVVSSSDPQQMLDRLVEAAVYLSGADEGCLLLQDPDSGTIRLCAEFGRSGRPASAEGSVHAEDLITEDRLVQRVFESGEPLILPSPDVTALDPSLAHDPAARPQPLLSLMHVPIKLRGKSIGMLRVVRLPKDGSSAGRATVGRGEPVFSPDDLSRLSSLVHFTALAIENARLRQEMQEQAERMTICEIGALFGSTLQLEAVLEMVMEVAIRIIDAERGYIALWDEETDTYVARMVYALRSEPLETSEFPFGGDIARRVLEEGEAILTAAPVADLYGGQQETMRAVLCVPIRGASRIVGAIYIDHRDHTRYFAEYHRDVLSALSVNAAAAVENARLFNQVEAERSKLDAVIRGTDQPVIVTDGGGTVLLMNRAAHRVLSTRRSRATGMLLPLVSDHPALARLLNQARASGNVQYGEIALSDDQTYSATVTPVPGVGFIIMMQDVTELKRLSQMKSEFVATVSHDLRSPLSVVLGLLSVLDQAGPLTAKQHDFVASAEQEIKHLLDLTGDLLDLGRLEASIDLDMAPCDFRQLVKESVLHWRNQVRDAQHQLSVDLPPGRIWVYGNVARLGQVVDNLVNNAIKYTLPGGQIVVRLTAEGQEAVLRVQDSGIGIGPQDQPYVFDRFYRVYSAETEHIEGTGLGLAIVKSIIERHDGRVWLESEPGHGSTFGVALPLLEAEQAE